MADTVFKDRKEAGEKLGEFLRDFQFENPIVFGIPRGGVVVAAEVAKKLECTLDVLPVRKLGVPGNSELAFGALAPENVMLINEGAVERMNLSTQEIKKVEQNERAELDRRVELYRGTQDYPDLSQNTAIIVDDGLATGATARAAIGFIQKLHPRKVVLAAPVCTPDVYELIEQEVDEAVCLETPTELFGISEFYLDFPQTSDEEVQKSLSLANHKK
jgi:putative phosphoribosyl transferase